MAKKIHYTIPGNWDVRVWINDDGNSASNDTLTLATLCVIRDELKKLNALLHCSNFVEIPSILRTIKRNTTKKKRPKSPPKLRVVGGNRS